MAVPALDWPCIRVFQLRTQSKKRVLAEKYYKNVIKFTEEVSFLYGSRKIAKILKIVNHKKFKGNGRIREKFYSRWTTIRRLLAKRCILLINPVFRFVPVFRFFQAQGLFFQS
jgi:hypothetical protein